MFDEWILGKGHPVYKQAIIGRVFGKIALKGLLKNEASMKRNMVTIAGFRIKETAGDIKVQKDKWGALIREYEYFSNPVGRKLPYHIQLFEASGPLLIRLLNESCAVGVPAILHARVFVEIQLPVNDGPLVRIDIGGTTCRRGKRSVTAVSRRVILRIGLEQITIFSAYEIPVRAIPIVGKGLGAFSWRIGHKISDGIIAVNRACDGLIHRWLGCSGSENHAEKY